MTIWYRFFKYVTKLLPIFTYVKIGYQFFTPEKQVAHRATIAHLRAMINLWGLLRYSRASNATVSDIILLKIELIKNIMYVLITCKFKKSLINSNREKVETSILRHSMAAKSLVSRQIWPKFKLIQAFMHVLITCKYQKDRIKNNKDTMDTPFSPL